MLVINVMWKCLEGKREEFIKAVKEEGIDTASRAEDGCFKYDFYVSVEDPDDVFLLEYWRDQDAHSAHRTQKHYARLDEIKAVYLADQKVKKYFADDEA